MKKQAVGDTQVVSLRRQNVRQMVKGKLTGYFFGAAAAISYGMNPLFALPLYHDGLDADSVLFFRYFIGVLILATMLFWRQPKHVGQTGEYGSRLTVFALGRRNLFPLIFYGVMMALSSLCLFVSYNFMDAGIASTLLFVYPIMVAVIMTVFFREKLKWQTVASIVTALTGILLLYRQGNGATLNVFGTLMVFGSALTYAIYLVGINRHGLNELPTLKVTFYVLLFGLAVFVARIGLRGEFHVPSAERWYLWFNLIALGLIPTVLSLSCTTIAIQHIGSTPTAILGALEPATAVFFGITVFGEQLTCREAIGLILIILAVTVIVADGKLPHLLTGFKKLFPKSQRK